MSKNLIQQMQAPEFYPHPVQQDIELVQTHISYVFLTGEYAYKVKKPVNFGFLDFSTLEQRKHFCNEELRMNKPIAPDIYLEVIPITKSGKNEHQFVLGGTGEVVEYALKMRQFPQECLLSNMFAQGTLTEGHIAELGRLVADFHSHTVTNDYIRSFGEIAKIRQSIDENYQQTNKYIGAVQTKEQYEATKQFTDNFFLSREDVFKARQAQDKIRECHGDLHLRNISLWHDKIQLFDRIEFNEPFRFVDVMYDVAFAVMDLDARGRKDFANIFLNTYLEQTGDWEGLQLLPLYLSRQAYVRAKVTSFLLDDPDISDQDKQQAAQTASDYYRLAWEYTNKNQGRLVLMSGLSGSGKTTIAQQLAKKNGAIHLRSDVVRKHLAGISLTQRGGDELYTPEMSEKTYTRLLELGEMLLKEGYTVILDAKFDRREWRKKAIALCQANYIPLKIISCEAPLDILSDRLQERRGDVSDATPDLLTQQQQTAESFTEAELAYVIKIDTSNIDGETIFDNL